MVREVRMRIPEITNLQFLVLSILIEGEILGASTSRKTRRLQTPQNCTRFLSVHGSP